MIEVLAQIKMDKGRAGIVLWDNRVVETAPALRFMRGWTRIKVINHCEAKRWSILVIHKIDRKDIDAEGRATALIDKIPSRVLPT